VDGAADSLLSARGTETNGRSGEHDRDRTN
jgi:hypothetical protein